MDSDSWSVTVIWSESRSLRKLDYVIHDQTARGSNCCASIHALSGCEKGKMLDGSLGSAIGGRSRPWSSVNTAAYLEAMITLFIIVL